MNNYLFFRTDRIGDFLMSAVLIKSIKRNDSNSHITVITSNKNHFYIKTLNFIDDVFLYPENFIQKIFFFLKLRKKKYHLISALDGKKRSIYFSIFINAKIKVLMTTKILFKKILSKFFTKIYYFNQSRNKIEEIKDVLKLCKMNLDEKDINFLEDHNMNNNVVNLTSNYITFHFDEKWIYDQYIKKYQSIQPSINEFELLMNKLVEKTNKNLVITTGQRDNKIINEYLISCDKINENLFEKKSNGKIIQIFNKLDFFDLKFIIKHSNYIITCHGAATHLASALNIKIYDIFDKSQEIFYKKWNGHMRNYHFFYRENFRDLSKKLINIL